MLLTLLTATNLTVIPQVTDDSEILSPRGQGRFLGQTVVLSSAMAPMKPRIIHKTDKYTSTSLH